MRDFRGDNRFAEQESLDLHASFGAQDLELFLGFHAFRRGDHAQA
jgi:hypothetical protein